MTNPPSWEDFCEQMLKIWPDVMPDQGEQRWMNLYTVYEMGFSSCLAKVQKLLEEEANPQ